MKNIMIHWTNCDKMVSEKDGGVYMNEKTKIKTSKIILLALKIGVGGSVAYFIAEWLKLDFASSAGIIALLTP